MEAARCFYDMLVLQSKSMIEMQQDEAFGALTIVPVDDL